MRVFTVAAVSVSLFWHHQAATEDAPYSNSSQYSEGKFGDYPLQDFRSADLIGPQINQIRHGLECNDNLYTFFTPHTATEDLSSWQATIFNNEGHLVWSTGWHQKAIYNLMVQTYKGEQVLTFWAGDTDSGLGSGMYYMLDSTYSVVKTISDKAGNGMDLHEFFMTSDETALATTYVPVNHTFISSGNATTMTIWDCLMQDIDLETEEVIFEWSAAEHIDIGDSHIDHRVGIPGTEFRPSDWFHMNSIDKDRSGNYLISSCFAYSLYYIDGSTGEILWILGGKRNMFEDKSGGHATNFSGQHHARWTENYTEITLFDNAIGTAGAEPRGLRLAIDPVAMTVEVVQEYLNPWKFTVPTQGSMQDLPNGNVLVGYGSISAYTEFTKDGRPVCETHFGPASNFGMFTAQSYRVLKFPWTGYPSDSPSLGLVQEDAHGAWRAYVSWNGATEIGEWVLQEASAVDASEQAWTTVQTKMKEGFETVFTIKHGYEPYFRVKAIGKHDMGILGMTGVVHASGAGAIDPGEVRGHTLPGRNELLWVFIGLLGSVIVATAAAMVLMARRRSQYHLVSSEDGNGSVRGVHDMNAGVAGIGKARNDDRGL